MTLTPGQAEQDEQIEGVRLLNDEEACEHFD